MGSLLKTSWLPPAAVGFLLLIPALVYCDRLVSLDLFVDTNCTYGANNGGWSTTLSDTSQAPNTSFPANALNTSLSFESAILTNVTGDVVSLVACQAGLPCNLSGVFQISFNLGDIGACSTAGPPGTRFDKFLLS